MNQHTEDKVSYVSTGGCASWAVLPRIVALSNRLAIAPTRSWPTWPARNSFGLEAKAQEQAQMLAEVVDTHMSIGKTGKAIRAGTAEKAICKQSMGATERVQGKRTGHAQGTHRACIGALTAYVCGAHIEDGQCA